MTSQFNIAVKGDFDRNEIQAVFVGVKDTQPRTTEHQMKSIVCVFQQFFDRIIYRYFVCVSNKCSIFLCCSSIIPTKTVLIALGSKPHYGV